uniref:Cytokinin riboside 5'-monophosphate phosphoribohydrolase n=1 Tax=Polytomella parva TaxID=51329 RepID=A0A7S0VMW6_9CHLO|mmetsp:Transcript_7461/g.14678  ORF Transcript_7461/g.14678 Transcript_7461/m.14678 type:complete len:226 (+) Transcript_7461:72-749(+)
MANNSTLEIRKICVFCGASSGNDPKYVNGAKAMGNALVKENIGLVYGGGNLGLMGEIARTVVSGSGTSAVTGVIPAALAPREISGQLIGEVHTVPDMHSRKALMASHSDAFIAMPGGFGTFEELLEVLTWQQLGFHAKPIGLLNINKFWDPLLAFLDHTVSQEFVQQRHRDALIVSEDPEELIRKLKAFKPTPSLLEEIRNKNGGVVPVGVDISKTSDEAESFNE